MRSVGSVVCSGYNTSAQLGDGTRVDRLTPVPVVGLDDAISASVANRHSCALRSAGSVVCWGANDVGQLGDGTRENRSTPVPVALPG